MARKREFNKEKVLEQAMLLFWQKGYEATSIRDLKKVMGISSSSMYETFGDKRNIFLTALERYCAIELEQISGMLQENSDVKSFIEALFQSIDRVLPGRTQAYGSMTFNTMAEFGMSDSTITDILYSHFFAIAEIIASVIRQAQQNSSITTTDDPLQLAHVILSSLQGLATIKSMKPDYPYAGAYQQIILRVLKS